jgi:hypothetical protein
MTDHDPIAECERKKYARIWALPSYRVNSPGRNIAPLALEKLGAQPGETLMDFGCGEAKAVDWFRSHKIKAVGCDLVQLRDDVIPACLWDLPEDFPVSDHGFSADVLEHIPPDKVEDTLCDIARTVRGNVFFQIATTPDVHGEKIGETLHLTVEPADWWGTRLRHFWASVELGACEQDWRFWALCRGQ